MAAKLTVKMVAACREFRRWSLTHQAEFGLLFGVPLPGLDDGRYDVADECALAFAGTFLALFLELWNAVPFPVPEAADIDPGLRDQLRRYRDALGTDLPVGAVLTFLRCWTVLYGAVAMEVFGHLRFALEDPAPMFELTLSRSGRPGRPALPGAAVGRPRAERGERGGGQGARGQQLDMSAAAASCWMRRWNRSTAAGTATSPSHTMVGLSRSGSAAPVMPGHHGRPAFGRGQRREGAHRGQADQPVGHGHPEEPADAAPLAPVRHRVEREVRGHAGREGRRRAAGQGADQRSGQDVVGQQHAYHGMRPAPRDYAGRRGGHCW